MKMTRNKLVVKDIIGCGEDCEVGLFWCAMMLKSSCWRSKKKKKMEK
jgi:hypothetical protein